LKNVTLSWPIRRFINLVLFRFTSKDAAPDRSLDGNE